MKFNQYEISSLSSMICGDRPYKKTFPYRKIEKISVFFSNIGFNYTFDNTISRKKWVESVLTDINNKANADDESLSSDMKQIIQAMLNPNDYGDLLFTNFNKAKKIVEKLLKEHGIKLSDVIENISQVNPKKINDRQPPREDSGIENDPFLHIKPLFFTKPKRSVESNKISVMMPLSTDFNEVYNSIKDACKNKKMQCYRADHVWNDSVIIQDIFELIFTSEIIIADFTTRNPNVFYEVGIAHTLGKNVIPIAQNIADVPFDLHHHRVLVYHNNNEGRDDLRERLSQRINTLKEKIHGAV